MYKFAIVMLLVVSATVLTACGKEDAKEVQSTSYKEEQKTNATFDDGILETDTFKLSVKKSEVIKSPTEESEGLFITYELENKSDSDIVPREVLNYLVATQENDTSRINLENNYYFLDAFGDDPTTYNKMVDIDNATANALLPGKTVEFQNAIYLDNHDKPVVMTATDDAGVEIGSYEVTVE